MYAIRSYYEELVVIGGGFIGLEFAAVARKLGKSVRVLVRGARLLQNALSPELSDYMQRVHEQAGVEICLNSEIEHYARSGDVV